MFGSFAEITSLAEKLDIASRVVASARQRDNVVSVVSVGDCQTTIGTFTTLLPYDLFKIGGSEVSASIAFSDASNGLDCSFDLGRSSSQRSEALQSVSSVPISARGSLFILVKSLPLFVVGHGILASLFSNVRQRAVFHLPLPKPLFSGREFFRGWRNWWWFSGAALGCNALLSFSNPGNNFCLVSQVISCIVGFLSLFADRHLLTPTCDGAL